MGVLLPALSSARKMGQATVCRSNLKQIGLAANFYAEAWNFFIPRGTSSLTKTWFQLFMPYLSGRSTDKDYRNVKMYRCPSYPNRNQPICYVVNGWKFANVTDTVGAAIDEPTRIFGLKKLDTKIYLADNEDGPNRNIITEEGCLGWDMCDVWSPSHLASDANTPGDRRVARTRHSQGKARPGCHYLFLDGHVEWMMADTVTYKSWRFEYDF
jgi:prepilin-type processing-associated H-X9-DG protein